MKQFRPTTKRHRLDPKEMQPLLEELLPVGAGEAPSQVTGWIRKGNWTRLQAHYPNGFGLTVYFDKHGNVSSCEGSAPLIMIGGQCHEPK